MSETIVKLNRVAEVGHLHELYKYPQSTISIPTRTTHDIATFSLPKGLWLLTTNWYFYGSNPTWPAASWYRLYDSQSDTNVLNYKCMDANESYQGVQIVDTNGTTITVRAYCEGTGGKFNVSRLEVYGVKIR